MYFSVTFCVATAICCNNIQLFFVYHQKPLKVQYKLVRFKKASYLSTTKTLENDFGNTLSGVKVMLSRQTSHLSSITRLRGPRARFAWINIIVCDIAALRGALQPD